MAQEHGDRTRAVVRDGKVGSAYTNRVDDEGLAELARRAGVVADSARPDPLFPGLAPCSTVPAGQVQGPRDPLVPQAVRVRAPRHPGPPAQVPGDPGHVAGVEPGRPAGEALPFCPVSRPFRDSQPPIPGAPG